MNVFSKLAIAGCVVTTLGICGDADAGYVFLKNGYILQGRITERTEASVVLDYPGGQVTVQERFIKHVVLDPSEEAMQERRKKDAEEVKSGTPELETDVALELPDIGELVALDRMTVSSGDPSLDPDTSTSIDPIDSPITTAPVEVVQIPNPVADDVPVLPTAAEPTVHEPLGVTVSAPSGWVVDDSGPVLELRSSAGADAARLTVQRRVSEALSVSEVEREFRNALEAFEGVTVVDEQDVQVGFERARAITVEDEARDLRFVQVLIRRNGAVYLVGTQCARDADETTRDLLDRALNSIAFVD